MNAQKVIIMADSRMRVAPNDRDTVKRHTEYIEEFCKLENFEDTELFVIQPSLKVITSFITKFDKLTVLKISIKDLLQIQKKFRSEKYEVILIVAGDPWESYLFSELLRLLLSNLKSPVQLQIHAELSDAWAKLSLRNRIRRQVAFRTLKKAQGIRVVSTEQRKYLIERLLIDPSRIVAIPVRLNLDQSISTTRMSTRPMSIGLVGRIHKERNIKQFIQIARYFLIQIPDLRIVIAGNSSGSSKLVRMLREISTSQVDFLGSLESNEMDSAWSRIGVLVSPAQSESYGRSIREALMRDVPVLAFCTMGARDLQSECPDSVQLFSGKQRMSELFKMYQYLLGSRVPGDFAINQQIRDSKISYQIAASWKDAVERKSIR